jgi:hypothetical protein
MYPQGGKFNDSGGIFASLMKTDGLLELWHHTAREPHATLGKSSEAVARRNRAQTERAVPQVKVLYRGLSLRLQGLAGQIITISYRDLGQIMILHA